jgi:hypothetical protein
MILASKFSSGSEGKPSLVSISVTFWMSAGVIIDRFQLSFTTGGADLGLKLHLLTVELSPTVWTLPGLDRTILARSSDFCFLSH